MLRYIMIRFRSGKGPQKLNCVPPPPPPPPPPRGMSDHVVPLLNLFCMPIRTFLPKFDVTFAGKTHVKVHNYPSASFPC